MHRWFALFVALVLTGSFASGLAAQDATPAANGDLGLPEVNVTLTDTAIEGVPTELAAGRYLVSVTVDVSEEMGGFGAVGFVQLPEGKTAADLVPPSTAADASPVAEMEMEMASPVAGEEDPLAWLFETYIAGGTGGDTGGTYRAIVDLPAGNYAVWADDPESPQPSVEVTVSGDLAAVTFPVPTADVTIREVKTADGYAFEIEGALTEGEQLVQVVNDSDQPHFVLDSVSATPVTEEQIFALFESFETGTPTADVSEDQFTDAMYAAVQSAGSTQWIYVDLPVGYHFLACYVPDLAKGGIPHVFEGMIEIVPVGV